MARPLEFDELVEHFTLVDEDLKLLRNKSGPTRLGFALLMKFLIWRGRFPQGRAEFPDNAVDHVARQVGVSAAEVGLYDWDGRQIKRHRVVLRRVLGFRECSVADAEKLTFWLAGSVAHAERRVEQVRLELLAHCHAERIEPPERTRVDRIVASALRQAEEALFARVAGRLGAPVVTRLLDLVAPAASRDSTGRDDPAGVLALIRSVPGNVSLESMLTEIDKLLAVRAVAIPADVFAGVAPKVVAGWRAQAAVESPSHLWAHPNRDKTVTLLAALLQARQREITDALVELLISTVHRIGARAEKRVTAELVNAFKRVTGKENILFAVADAALAAPDDPVRQVVFPAVRGGEATVRDLVHEYKTKGPVYRRIVRTTLKASYTNHYRRGLIRLVQVLAFRSGNSVHRPVLDALELAGRYSTAGNLKYYPLAERPPAHRGTGGDWADLVSTVDNQGRRRTVRMAYEVATFQALCDQLRCKEIWVDGAEKWRNPDEDLPHDFDERRSEHYSRLRKPLDPSEFIATLQTEMRAELGALDDELPRLGWVDVAERKAGAIRLSPLDAEPEPRNLRQIKAEVHRRWGTVPLIDMLKEAVLRTSCLNVVTSVAGRSAIGAEDLAERLLLAIYGYGTNTGIRAVAAGEHGHSEDDIRYVRRRYLSPDAARAIAVQIANATFTARAHTIWGEGSTAVASDSTHFRAFDQNIFTEWHSRYGGRGVLIYWHVERGSVVVHSQLLSCSASEVHAMVEGAIRHGTSMSVAGNYVDSHGQSEIGFGITRLLGFDLLPRIKQINKVRLYRPASGEPDVYPRLQPALTRPIRWDLIAQQYDQMVKYATAIRVGTASTEAILRRFTRTASHPTYAAMLEVGRAQKTIFTARYLRLRELQREINSGLNVVESWNRANTVVCYGKGGELATNRREEQEMTMLCLRILQAALVYVNTLMLQDVLADDDWAALLTGADRRGLTPLFWQHVLPYGEIRLDMSRRLGLAVAPAGGDA
ncbi:Tn3 family transposase [Actinoplanes sp. NPDC051513]|uniref:Tn3 family transposase n=1 Tax=Actinoplanes sp. NPDC051513 TaxID=3363908 RepID=UPI0037B0DC59